MRSPKTKRTRGPMRMQKKIFTFTLHFSHASAQRSGAFIFFIPCFPNLPSSYFVRTSYTLLFSKVIHAHWLVLYSLHTFVTRVFRQHIRSKADRPIRPQRVPHLSEEGEWSANDNMRLRLHKVHDEQHTQLRTNRTDTQFDPHYNTSQYKGSFLLLCIDHS